MASEPDVAASKAIQQETGRTFHVATRLLPERIRHATYALYGFFRVADDVVDDPAPDPPPVQRRRLRELRAIALGERDTDDPVLVAFRQFREEYDIDPAEVDTFLAAMEMDVDRTRYDTFEELESYLRGSAVAVAYMMLSVMDPEDAARARPHARALGEAFQLTNFLRDVREDVVDYDRIYLPRETLARHGVSFEDVENLEISGGMRAAIRSELRRTERRYREGVAGIKYLPEDCQFAVLLSAVLYAEHHRLIRRQNFDTVSNRPSLSTARRLSLVARTWFHWRRLGDPEATFERVSAVPAEESPSGEAPAPPVDDRPTVLPDAPTAGDGDGSASGTRDRPTRWRDRQQEVPPIASVERAGSPPRTTGMDGRTAGQPGGGATQPRAEFTCGLVQLARSVLVPARRGLGAIGSRIPWSFAWRGP